MKKTKILFCGDSIAYPTGLAYVITNIMLGFTDKKYEVAYSILSGKDINANSEVVPMGDDFNKAFGRVKIYNCHNNDGNTEKNFDFAVNSFKPDIVISLSDPWNLEQIAFSRYKSSFLWVGYVPLETPHYPDLVMFPSQFNKNIRKSLKKILALCDVIIPVTTMGSDVIKNYGLNPTEHVYHGLDFSKRSTSGESKRKIFGEHVAEDTFIFMTMGKNNERKKLDKVLEAYLAFLKKNDMNKKYKLYVHTHIDEVCGGTDLVNFLVENNLKEYILFPSSYLRGQLLSTEELYKRYQLCDCYISLPGGEGFGYGFAEAMMHRKPCIYLDYGGHATYLKDIGIPVKVKDDFYARNINMKWALPDIEDSVQAMQYVVDNYDALESNVEKGFIFAKENFDWLVVRRKFRNIVEEAFKTFKKDELSEMNFKRII